MTAGTTAVSTAPSSRAEARAASVSTTTRKGFLPEVQALRALAVLAVVVYHLWPGSLTGGFVGVDVFFAISGFLITGHLLREATSTGRIRLFQFWGRRIRRLLPASLLVLGVTLIGVLTLIPKLRWEQFLGEIAASAAYFQNWALAASSIEYGAENDAPSPVQHFWSLAVEEQLYLVWPVIIGAILLLTWKAPKAVKVAAIGVVLVAIAAASLYFSILFTTTNPSEAYFVTGTRVWEFAAGGLLAIIGTAVAKVPGMVRTIVSIAGWAAIWVAVFTFNEATAFPSYTAALPVLGTLAVIWAGSNGAMRSRIGSSAPAQFIGRVSYSVYLWHWPLMVFALTAGALTDMSKGILVAVTILLAWGTTTLVEDPVRNWAPLANGPFWKTAAATIIAMAVIIIPATLTNTTAELETLSETQRAHALVEANECYGAGTIAGVLDCADQSFGPSVPDQNFAEDDKAEIYGTECYAEIDISEVRSCIAGVVDSDFRVALIGDSHAAHWYPALLSIAETEGWALVPYLKSACPMSDTPRDNDEPLHEQACADYNKALAAQIDSLTDPFDMVIVSHSSVSDGRYGSKDKAAAGFQSSWKRFTDQGSKIVVIRDTPFMKEGTRDCVIAAGGVPGECAVPKANVFVEDMMETAAKGLDQVDVLSMTDLLCDIKQCDPVIGGVTVYRDTNHITATYMKSMVPYLHERLMALTPVRSS